jgi:hypothetical protein
MRHDMSEQDTKQSALITVGASGGLAPQNFEGVWRMSQIMASSGMMPKGMERPEAVFVAVQYGMELGMGAMASVQNIAVVNGRPTLWGDAMLGLVRGSGLLLGISESIEGDGDQMTAICAVSRKADMGVTESRFSVADAKRAGLWDKAGPWKQYPKRMLQMRARGFALRDKFPDVLRGLYAREEIEPEFCGEAEQVSSAAVLDRIKAPAKPGNAPADAPAPEPLTLTGAPTVADVRGWITDAADADELAAGIDQGTTAGASGDFVGDIDGTMVALGLSVIEIEWLHAISIDDAVSECPVGCMRMAALPKLCAGIGQVGRESEMGECFATCISLENDEVFRLISC